MTALYTKLDNFFNCCNVPLSIIDLNSNFLYERNLNKKEKILDMMLGTRKSRKGQAEETTSFADLLSDAINGTDFVIEQKPDGIE